VAGVLLEVKLEDAAAREMIERIARRASDFRPLLAVMGERMRQSIGRNFREGGRPEKWKPSRRAKAKGGQTLIDTGRLRSSITYEAGPRELKVGTNVVYARIHQLGGRIEGVFGVRAHSRLLRQAFGRPVAPRRVTVRAYSRRVDMELPARPFLVVQPEDVRYFREEIEAYLAEVGG